MLVGLPGISLSWKDIFFPGYKVRDVTKAIQESSTLSETLDQRKSQCWTTSLRRDSCFLLVGGGYKEEGVLIGTTSPFQRLRGMVQILWPLTTGCARTLLTPVSTWAASYGDYIETTNSLFINESSNAYMHILSKNEQLTDYGTNCNFSARHSFDQYVTKLMTLNFTCASFPISIHFSYLDCWALKRFITQ